MRRKENIIDQKMRPSTVFYILKQGTIEDRDRSGRARKMIIAG